ncbi:MAG: hypothetical protein WCC36_16225 [Gammaproteobacteria bacterium]
MVTGDEPTANEGRDLPPEWPYDKAYEPYTTAAPDSIRITRKRWHGGHVFEIPPYSVVTLVAQPTCLSAAADGGVGGRDASAI